MLHKKTTQGFTIVELLIVIVVIGILAALVLNTFTGVQKRARDTDRQNDITQMATQLEVYFNDNGKYPTTTNMQDANPTTGWIKTNLKGMDLNATIAPGVTPAANANSITTAAAANKDQYGYVPLDSTAAACTNAAGDECVTFTLSYWKEELKSGETNPISKKSLN